MLLCKGLFLQIEHYTAIRLIEDHRAQAGDHRVDGEGTYEGHSAEAEAAEQTQAAIWARTHLGALLENVAA